MHSSTTLFPVLLPVVLTDDPAAGIQWPETRPEKEHNKLKEDFGIFQLRLGKTKA